MRLKVETLTGEEHDLEVAPQDTVRDVKVCNVISSSLIVQSVNFCRFQNYIFVNIICYLFYLFSTSEKTVWVWKSDKTSKAASRPNRP